MKTAPPRVSLAAVYDALAEGTERMPTTRTERCNGVPAVTDHERGDGRSGLTTTRITPDIRSRGSQSPRIQRASSLPLNRQELTHTADKQLIVCRRRLTQPPVIWMNSCTSVGSVANGSVAIARR